MARKQKVLTANAGAMRQLLEANKYETRLLGRIQEHMLGRDEDERDQEHLHPSEISKKDWCPRQSYYRIAGFPQRTVRDKSYVLENIFDEGHEVHGKWQQRINAMGMLRGRWLCLTCMHKWEGVSPSSCPKCDGYHLEYREVFLFNEKHLIMGHADGDVAEGHDDIADDPLIEIKTIGLGTLRVEQPGLLADHTHKVEIETGEQRTLIDLDRLWQSIKRPFPSHLRQGMIYCFVLGRTTIVFIYECKWNQQTKEFVVRYKPEYVEDILDQCLDVKYALKVGEPPGRPGWADVECKACSSCPFSETCWDLGTPLGTPLGESIDDNESGRGAGSRGRGSEGRAGQAAARATSEAEVRAAEDPAHDRRRNGRSADGIDGRPDSVDGLPRRVTGGSGGRRKVRRVRPAEG